MRVRQFRCVALGTPWPRSLRRFACVASLTTLSLAASASLAAASVTVGQVGTASLACVPVELAQERVFSGASYMFNEAGTVTAWSHLARTGTGQQVTMKVFRKIDDPNVYQVVGHDGPHPIAGGMLNIFSAHVPVQPGDILGMHGGANVGCAFPATSGDTVLAWITDLADGEAAQFSPSIDERVNISATFEPFNTFTLAAITSNKKKGSATLSLNLPNPGELSASGRGVKAASAGRAVISKAVGAGPAQLLIKAKGKQKKKLKRKGKVKLNVAVTYAPKNGDPATQAVKVKLKKKR